MICCHRPDSPAQNPFARLIWRSHIKLRRPQHYAHATARGPRITVRPSDLLVALRSPRQSVSARRTSSGWMSDSPDCACRLSVELRARYDREVVPNRQHSEAGINAPLIVSPLPRLAGYWPCSRSRRWPVGSRPASKHRAARSGRTDPTRANAAYTLALKWSANSDCT
jgi:hypothetical protein